jgi:hypothetical protein
MSTVAMLFSFPAFVSLLVWLALAAMAFWVWSGTKANSTLMTLIGAGVLAIDAFFGTFGIWAGDAWLEVGGVALVTLGYYYTVKPVVDAHVRDLKAKALAKASHPSTTPPTASTTPPASPPT